jgi:hypothetical protein
MNIHMSANVHVHADSAIAITHQVGETYEVPVLKLGVSYPGFVNIFFDSPTDVRRLRDALDAYLVGRLGEEA